MTLQRIRLPGGEWSFNDVDLLGEAGGFGEIFRGHGEGGEVAIKRLKLNAAKAAHRELDIGNQLLQRTLNHVVPVIDAGQDAESDRYFLVMPVCEYSLQDIVNKAQGAIDPRVANDSINSIIAGLTEVNDITHRDLKPANILFHERAWKIADFGIAKFVEDSTSMDTLRKCLTPTYAAPEQWRGERPSTATDIYALGCIIHTLFLGHPPFQGEHDDIRDHHLHTAPPVITCLSPRISAFVSQMLRKPPGARPSLDRCSQVLINIGASLDETVKTHPAIEDATVVVAQREAEREAEQQIAQTARRERNELFDDSKREMLAIKNRLFESIKDCSENVMIDRRGDLVFGSAKLRFPKDPEQLEERVAAIHAKGKPYEHTGWDVLGWALIGVECEKELGCSPYIWSASLLFADRHDGNGFRWYELSFWKMGQTDRDEPFGLKGYEGDIDIAAGNIVGMVNLAYGPLTIDGEDEADFIYRWTGLVAKAATGELSRPNGMPIHNFSL